MVIDPRIHRITPPEGLFIEFNHTEITGYRKQEVTRTVGVIESVSPHGSLLIRHALRPALTSCLYPHPGFNIRPILDTEGNWILR